MHYADERPLLTKKYLEAVKKQEQKGAGDVKVPSFEYDIEGLINFEFQGVSHMMIYYSNRTVQLYEWETGLFVYEFDFDDNKISGQDSNFVKVPGMSGGGLGIITDCKHWEKEAEDKNGGRLSSA